MKLNALFLASLFYFAHAASPNDALEIEEVKENLSQNQKEIQVSEHLARRQAARKNQAAREAAQRELASVDRRKRKRSGEGQGSRKRARGEKGSITPLRPVTSIFEEKRAPVTTLMKQNKTQRQLIQELRALEGEAQEIEEKKEYIKPTERIRSIYPVVDGPFVWIPEELLVKGALVPHGMLKYKSSVFEEADYVTQLTSNNSSAVDQISNIHQLKLQYGDAVGKYREALGALSLLVQNANERVNEGEADMEDETDRVYDTDEFNACLAARLDLSHAELNLASAVSAIKV